LIEDKEFYVCQFSIVNDKLNNLSEDIDYLKHKEQQNERDIFTLKKKTN